MTVKRFLYTLVLSFILISHAHSYSINGLVISISDGDTVTIITPEKIPVKIRLANIDAPESGQAFGQSSKKILSNLIYKKNVNVEISGDDKYKRKIGTIYINNTNINSEMIALGAAWVYKKYNTDTQLLDLEYIARQKELGLWGLSAEHHIPPWEWRKNKNSNTTLPAKKDYLKEEDVTCGNKTYCKEMSSCKEALFYLNHCNATKIDGDRDGIPCEKLCNPK